MAFRCNLIIKQGMDISSNIHVAYQWTFFLVVPRPRSFRHLILLSPFPLGLNGPYVSPTDDASV